MKKLLILSSLLFVSITANAYQVTEVIDGNRGMKTAYVTCDNGSKWTLKRYSDGKWGRFWFEGAGWADSLDEAARKYCGE